MEGANWGEDSHKPLVVSSGLLFVSPQQLATEDMRPVREGAPRLSEPTAYAFAERGVRASAIRLSPTVHGAGDHGFIPQIIEIARAKGVSAYVGDGASRWPAVHRTDAASLFRVALEKGTAGQAYHGVGEEGVATREIAELIGRRLGLPVVSKAPEEAMEHFGFMGMFFGLDSPASNAMTREALDWTPTGPSLLADMEAHYFNG